MSDLWDVAISFLSGDERLATKLYEDLAQNFSVFVYSKRQEELAGTDGLESLRQAFLSKSRLVVVLYRDGWGSTRWTSVEELAIKDRVFNGEWRSLLFVMLDDLSTPPGRLPETHIRLSYAGYGEALLGAIKMRAQELGSALRVETALDKAKRAQSSELTRANRERLFREQGYAAYEREHKDLRQQLDKRIEEIQSHLTTIELEAGASKDEDVIRTQTSSLNFYPRMEPNLAEYRIIVQEFDAPLILPKDRAHRGFLPGEGPTRISESEFCLDLNAAQGWCWRKSGDRELLSTADLGEYLIKRVLELHEEFRTGKRSRRRGTEPPGRSYRRPWS